MDCLRQSAFFSVGMQYSVNPFVLSNYFTSTFLYFLYILLVYCEESGIEVTYY